MEGQGVIETQDRTVDHRFMVFQALDCSNLGRTKATWYTAVPPTCQCSSGLSPADYFGRTMTENLPDSITIGIINVSVAGCDIRLFDKDKYLDYDSTYTASWFLQKVKAYEGNPYKYLIDLAKLAQQDGVIKGILLHQGETNNGDSQWPLYVQTIYDNFMNDLSLIPDSVPLIAGEVVNADQGGTSASMNSIINLLPNTIPTAYVISSSGCPADESLVHFSSEGYREMGRRYAEKMLSLITQAGPAAYLNISQTTLSLGYQEGSTNTFNITSNVNWIASSSESWLTLNPTSGSGDGTITLTAQKNPDTSTRTATISVSGTGVTSMSVTVTQGGAPAYLDTPTSSVSIGYQEGSTNTFNITSNVNWAASCSDTWLTHNPTSGSGDGTITLTAQKNSDSSTRTATISVSGTGVTSRSVTVSQGGSPAYLNAPTSSLSIGYQEGSTNTLSITSNVIWTASSSETWLTLNPTSGSGDGSITLTAQKNPNTSRRTAIISVSGTGVTTKPLAVSQEGAPTGISDPENKLLVIYPNPTNTILTIEGLIQEAQVSIYDVLGRLVLNKMLVSTSIDISSIAPGIYTIVLETRDDIIKMRLIKK